MSSFDKPDTILFISRERRSFSELDIELTAEMSEIYSLLHLKYTIAVPNTAPSRFEICKCLLLPLYHSVRHTQDNSEWPEKNTEQSNTYANYKTIA